MRFFVLLGKELRELARSYKLLFVPLVFIILALGQPVAMKLLPQLLEGAGNLPPGAIIEIPQPPPPQVAAGIIGQLNQMGILVLVLAGMGAVAAERASGVAATVLSKPVRRGAYLGAKATAFAALATLSLALALLAGGYYTVVLLGPVDWGGIAWGTLLYLPNLLLAVAVTMSFSSLLKSPLAAGGAALAALVALNLAPRLLGGAWPQAFPGALTGRSALVIAGAPLPAGALPHAVPAVVTLGLAALFLLAGWAALRRQEI